DGITTVTNGTILSLAQLTGLEFRPNPHAYNQTATFTYRATDAVGNNAPGTVTLNTGAPAQSGFHLNLIPDDSVGSASAEFKAALWAAADILERTMSDNITLNIRYGWGSYEN